MFTTHHSPPTTYHSPLTTLGADLDRRPGLQFLDDALLLARGDFIGELAADGLLHFFVEGHGPGTIALGELEDVHAAGQAHGRTDVAVLQGEQIVLELGGLDLAAAGAVAVGGAGRAVVEGPEGGKILAAAPAVGQRLRWGAGRGPAW